MRGLEPATPHTHLTSREASAIIFYRARMRMSISHIAKLLCRSTRTISKLISKNCWVHKHYDKRKWPARMRLIGGLVERMRFKKLLGWLRLWLAGYQGDISVLAEGEPP